MTPKKYPQNLHTPKKYKFFWKPKKILKFRILNSKKMCRAYVCVTISEYPPPPPPGAVIFKSLYMYKNKRENVWVPGSVEEIMTCPGVFGTKTTQKSTFFKMGVSLGRSHCKRDITWITDGGELGNNRYYIAKIPGSKGPRHSLITSHW